MLSSAVNAANGDDSMPGDYESWSGPAARNVPFGGLRPMMPTGRAPFPRLPTAPQTLGSRMRTPFSRYPAPAPTLGLRRGAPFPRPPMVPPTGRTGIGQPFMAPPYRPRRSYQHHRQRCLTPEIVIHRHSRRHSSCGRHRTFTIPCMSRPTLGLRGPPKCVLEVKRARCHRRRKCRSLCYDYDYDYDDQPQPLLAQPATIMANPVANTSLQATQLPLIVQTNNSAPIAASASPLSNLTQQMIDNLPRQTVVLPPIHLPGSHADANTELNTVIFPAEIINPANGTLSIIQANPGINGVATTNIQPTIAAPVQPQLINLSTAAGIPFAPARQPVLPVMTPTTSGLPFASGGPSASPAVPTNPLTQRFRELFQRLNLGQNRPILPAPNLPAIRPTLPNMSQFDPSSNTVNDPPIISPLNATNIRPYPSANIQPTNVRNNESYGSTSSGPYRPANITPYRPSTFAPSTSANNTTYQSANITPADINPYRPSTFTPSTSANNTGYQSANITPSNINPYRPANITSYTNLGDRSNNPLSQPIASTAATSYASTSSIAPSGSLTAFPSLSSPPSDINNNYINAPSSSAPFISTPSQTTNSMPKSILRNTPTTNSTPTTYTRLKTPNVVFE